MAPAMTMGTLQGPQSTPRTHLFKKTGQLLKPHCRSSARLGELGTAGRSTRYLQPKAEAGRAEQRKPAPSPWICVIPTMLSSVAKKRHQGIRETSDLGGGTRMINAAEGQGYDTVK